MAKVIIFIHGIGSNNSTWDKFIETLKSDSITKNYEEYIPNVKNVENNKIYYHLYEYNSEIINKSKIKKFIHEKLSGNKNAGDITMDQHSKTFENYLEMISDEFENINIIAHSMGGVILMNMLFEIIEKNTELLKKIDKCILYGSPLNGSNEPNELKKLLKLDISTDILNELKPNSNTISKLKQNIEINYKKLQKNFQIMFISGDSDSRIIDVKEETINKFGKFMQISGGHSEIIQPNLSSISFISFKKFLLSNIGTQLISIEDEDEIMKLNPEYLTKINDLGIKLNHINKDNIYLDDIFIYPDLQDIEDKKKLKINSEKLLNREDYKKCILFGDDVSGKTSLAYYYQKKMNDDGYIPLYFDAKNMKKSDIKTFENRMYLNLRKQYHLINRDNIENFRIIHKNKIIIIIDNIESLAIQKFETKTSFFSMLNKYFEHIILLSNDSFEMELMTKEQLKEKFDDFMIFRIKEFGYKLRDKIIDKWVHIGDSELTENELFEKKDEISRTIEVVIGNKFIPTYPLYLISLLQQAEAGTNNNLGGSAYAEFYNYLINQALGTTNIKPNELDFYHSYLSYIAFYYFTNNRKQLDKSEIEKLHEKFSEEIHKTSFHEVMKNLIEAKLIKFDNGYYSFMHNYIFYFFIAKYLSDNMGKRRRKEQIGEIIDSLIERLYRPQFANIIIFLIHHSKTSAEDIIDKIIKEAKKLFTNTKPSTLSKNELANINNLITQEIKVILEDKKPQDFRDEELEIKDEIEDGKYEIADDTENEEDEIIKYDEEIQELDIFSKLNLSMKIMEILGQITKNYYGSLEQIDKVEILNELTNLGLRNLNWLLKQFEEFQELLEHEIRKKIEKKNIENKEDIKRLSKKIIFDFADIMSIHFIKKISTSMASKNLFITIETLVGKNNNEAMKLIEIATKLEFSNGLNPDNIIKLNKDFEDNFIAKDLLKFFVINHLYKFDISYKKKQSVCKMLDISIDNQKKILITQATT